MIKGPWPLSADETHHVVPIGGPALTPMFNGERVALRVSQKDQDKVWGRPRGPRDYGVITDLDTDKRYAIRSAPCEAPGCYCDAEITEV